MANGQTFIKFNEICAATQQKMLAIIQHLARAWMFIRRSAATHIRTSLKHRDLESHVSQGTARGKSGQPAADYRD
jgi:ADP-glucose pyrophosphorylase